MGRIFCRRLLHVGMCLYSRFHTALLLKNPALGDRCKLNRRTKPLSAPSPSSLLTEQLPVASNPHSSACWPDRRSITHSATPLGGRVFTLRKSAVHSLSPLRAKLDPQLLAASGDAAMGRSARALLAGRRGGLGRSARSAIAGAVSPPVNWPRSARLVDLHLQGSARVWGSHLISATSTATACSYAPRTPRAPTPTRAKGRVCEHAPQRRPRRNSAADCAMR
jgi:hypothetical protein